MILREMPVDMMGMNRKEMERERETWACGQSLDCERNFLWPIARPTKGGRKNRIFHAADIADDDAMPIMIFTWALILPSSILKKTIWPGDCSTFQ